MTVRVTCRSDGKGHTLLRVDGEDVEGVGPRFVAVHRLAALAWGELDALDQPLDVHHRDTVPCHNSEANLEALPADAHGRVSAAQRLARARAADQERSR